MVVRPIFLLFSSDFCSFSLSLYFLRCGFVFASLFLLLLALSLSICFLLFAFYTVDVPFFMKYELHVQLYTLKTLYCKCVRVIFSLFCSLIFSSCRTNELESINAIHFTVFLCITFISYSFNSGGFF